MRGHPVIIGDIEVSLEDRFYCIEVFLKTGFTV